MLRVPRLRQPDPISCLPTAVWSVLSYLGYAVSYEEIHAACLLDREGAAQEVAVQALMECGYDVEVLPEATRELLLRTIGAEQPVVITLETARRAGSVYCHAVVVCDLVGDVLTVMDPLAGEYVEVSFSSVEAMLGGGIDGPVIVRGPDADLK